MPEAKPDSTTFVSWYEVKDDTAHFDMMLDWDQDQDGAKDDHYTGVQKRLQ